LPFNAFQSITLFLISIEIVANLVEFVAGLIEVVAILIEIVARLIEIVARLINFVAISIAIAMDSIALAANSIRPAAILIPTCRMEFGMTAVYCLLLSAVDVEHDADDEGEERFELEEVLPVGAAGVVACERVEREGAEEQADPEPDELSLPVPHSALEPLQLAQAVGRRL
jgi:hypothetical protein